MQIMRVTLGSGLDLVATTEGFGSLKFQIETKMPDETVKSMTVNEVQAQVLLAMRQALKSG